MLTGIDHLVIAVPDVDAAADALEREVGLRATGGGRHPGLGTVNRLVWLGDTYLELIGVEDRELAAASWIGAPTLATLSRSPGGGLATWAAATDDLATFVAEHVAAGVAWDGPLHGERRRPDQRVVRWRLTRAGELALDRPPFVIEHDVTAAEWTPAERRARAIERHPIGFVPRLTEVSIATADAPAVHAMVARSLGVAVDGSAVRIGGQVVAYLPSAAGPLASITIEASDGMAPEPRALDLLGCRFQIR